MNDPCQQQGNGRHQQERQPIAEVVGLQVFQYEVDVNEIEFQTHRTHERQRLGQPLGTVSQHFAEQ